MFERYTEKARRVIFFARYEASQYGSPYIETEHLLASILATHNPVLAKRCGRVLRLEHGVLRPDAAYQQAPLPVTEGEKS